MQRSEAVVSLGHRNEKGSTQLDLFELSGMSNFNDCSQVLNSNLNRIELYEQLMAAALSGSPSFKSKFSFLHPDQKITLDHSWEKLELGSL